MASPIPRSAAARRSRASPRRARAEVRQTAERSVASDDRSAGTASQRTSARSADAVDRQPMRGEQHDRPTIDATAGHPSGCSMRIARRPGPRRSGSIQRDRACRPPDRSRAAHRCTSRQHRPWPARSARSAVSAPLTARSPPGRRRPAASSMRRRRVDRPARPARLRVANGAMSCTAASIAARSRQRRIGVAPCRSAERRRASCQPIPASIASAISSRDAG